VGHEKIASMIEAELFVEPIEQITNRGFAPPIFKDGFERIESIAILSHVTPEGYVLWRKQILI
jgi:hypothetical protein